RVQNRNDLTPIIELLMSKHSSAWWLENMAECGVPCGPINTLDQVFNDPQVQHRQMQVALDHPDAGAVPSIANPIRFSDTPVQYPSSSPTLGQHSQQLQQLLNLPDAQWQDLKLNGIVE
ncbi:MAG: CoA transferase, partial [Motiliproteus sp.]